MSLLQATEMVNDILETALMALDGAAITDVICVSGVLRMARKPLSVILDEAQRQEKGQ